MTKKRSKKSASKPSAARKSASAVTSRSSNLQRTRQWRRNAYLAYARALHSMPVRAPIVRKPTTLDSTGRFYKRPELTPAWLVHRSGLSDQTKPERASRSVLKRQAEGSFKRWYEECLKRKARREVIIAKGHKPGVGKRAKPPSQRKPPSRLRCP